MDYAPFRIAQGKYRYPDILRNGAIANLVTDLVKVYDEGIRVYGFRLPSFLLYSRHSDVLTRTQELISLQMSKSYSSVNIEMVSSMDQVKLGDSSYLVNLDGFISYPIVLHSVGDVLNNRSVEERCKEVVTDFMMTGREILCVVSQNEELGYFLGEKINHILKKRNLHCGAFSTINISDISKGSYFFNADEFFVFKEVES